MPFDAVADGAVSGCDDCDPRTDFEPCDADPGCAYQVHTCEPLPAACASNATCACFMASDPYFYNQGWECWVTDAGLLWESLLQ